MIFWCGLVILAEGCLPSLNLLLQMKQVAVASNLQDYDLTDLVLPPEVLAIGLELEEPLHVAVG